MTSRRRLQKSETLTDSVKLKPVPGNRNRFCNTVWCYACHLRRSWAKIMYPFRSNGSMIKVNSLPLGDLIGFESKFEFSERFYNDTRVLKCGLCLNTTRSCDRDRSNNETLLTFQQGLGCTLNGL